MTFYVGQKVVSLRDWTWLVADGAVHLAHKNEIYTVRGVILSASGHTCLYLAELVNPPVPTQEGIMERPFIAKYFRPVVERTTDISIFNEILRKATRRIDA